MKKESFLLRNGNTSLRVCERENPSFVFYDNASDDEIEDKAEASPKKTEIKETSEKERKIKAEVSAKKTGGIDTSIVFGKKRVWNKTATDKTLTWKMPSGQDSMTFILKQPTVSCRGRVWTNRQRKWPVVSQVYGVSPNVNCHERIACLITESCFNGFFVVVVCLWVSSFCPVGV